MKYGNSTRKEASRRYYENHREEILAKRKAKREAEAPRLAERKRATRKALQAYVTQAKSVPCLDCGWDGTECPAAMDFDHVRGKKVATVSQLIRSAGSLEVLQEEIAKCEIVCTRCHRIRTVKRGQCGAHSAYD